MTWIPEPSRFEAKPAEAVEDGIQWTHGDARKLMTEAPFQWIDLDPFGSPVSFLDSAIQSISRVGVLEVTATDTAALCGSAKTSAARRYGSTGITDAYMHDDATRILLGVIARIAAMHDKAMYPILSLFDGHHVRVSVLLKRSKEVASSWNEHIGYRIRSEPYHFADQPSGEYSGPMWTGPIFDADIAGRMTIERAIELCAGKKTTIQVTGASWILNTLRERLREVLDTYLSQLNCSQANTYLLRLMIWELLLVSDRFLR